MKIGYPCINRTLGCKGDSTFRLKSYSEARLISTVASNLDCLRTMLNFNVEHNILFFRITSDLVPFASHPVCRFDWAAYFREEFQRIGTFIHDNGIRISMHPDQFTIINSEDRAITERSIEELAYHNRVLELLGLDRAAKIQLHIGGVYGDKKGSLERFVAGYRRLPDAVKLRLVIENDDRLFNVGDCLRISGETGLPVVFDVFHHESNSSGHAVREALDACRITWAEADGLPMVDYSEQLLGARKGRHAEALEPENFRKFLAETAPLDFDVMLEIKDKEISALKAVDTAASDRRFRARQTPPFLPHSCNS